MRYRFGEYQLDTERHALEQAGVPVKLERKVYQVLAYLVQHRERLVARDELLEHVWPGVYVAEAAVTRCIAALRQAVGDDRARQQVIQTLHGQGYRFVAPVTVGDETPPAPAPATNLVLAPASRASTAPVEADAAATRPPAPPGSREAGERKLVTVLCCTLALPEGDPATGDPDTPGRAQQEIDMRIALGPALMAAKGWAMPEVEQTYARARTLCAQLGDTPQLFPALLGLSRFYLTRGPLSTARELGQQLYRLAQHEGTRMRRLEACAALGDTLFFLGEFAAAWTHLEQGIALTDPLTERAEALRHGVAPGVRCLVVAANTLWCLGTPAQAVRRSQEALALARELAHPQSLAMVHHFIAFLHYHRREAVAVQAQADTLLTLATAQELPLWVGHGTCWRGWALAIQGQEEAGMTQLRQGLAAVLATGQTLTQPLHLVLLAEAGEHTGQVEVGLHLLAEALTAFGASGRTDLLAEAHRLQGVLLQRQAVPDTAQAEACFQQALAIARRQQAKSWELRAATSLSRLWQQQGKDTAARELLAPIYGWFTEGFDTADLQEAQALLEALGEGETP